MFKSLAAAPCHLGHLMLRVQLRSNSDFWAVSTPSMVPGNHKPWFRPRLCDNRILPAYLKDPRFPFKVSRPSSLWPIVPPASEFAGNVPGNAVCSDRVLLFRLPEILNYWGFSLGLIYCESCYDPLSGVRLGPLQMCCLQSWYPLQFGWRDAHPTV